MKISIKSMIVSCICAVALLQGILCQNVLASNTDVEISVSASKVANLLYQVVRKDKPIEQDLKFEIKDCEGNILYQGYTKNSIIRLEQVSFGKYSIIIYENNGKNHNFLVDVNSDYLKTQHELKYLSLEDIKSINTGDQTSLGMYTGILIVVLGVIFIMLLQKRRKYRE